MTDLITEIVYIAGFLFTASIGIWMYVEATKEKSAFNCEVKGGKEGKSPWLTVGFVMNVSSLGFVVFYILYKAFFKGSEYSFFDEPVDTRSNFWLNTIVCPSLDSRNELIEKANILGVMMRPIWLPMHKLPVFKDCPKGDLSNTEWFESRVVNIPSSPVEL